MSRYTGISSASFAGVELALPVSLKLVRSAGVVPGGSDNQRCATSLEIERPTVTAELVVRGVACVEGLGIGSEGELRVETAAGQSGVKGRVLKLPQAVLVGVELRYEQNRPAQAALRLAAVSQDGVEDGLTAEEGE